MIFLNKRPSSQYPEQITNSKENSGYSSKEEFSNSVLDWRKDFEEFEFDIEFPNECPVSLKEKKQG